MAVTNGINLRIRLGANTLSTVNRWTMNDSEQQAEAAPSNAGGGTIVTGGAKDCTISASGLQRVPVVYPGDAGTLTGNNGATEFTVAAICQSLDVSCEISASTNISVEYQFGGNGAITRQASALAADASEPDVWNTIGGAVLYTPTGQAEITPPDILGWTLRLERVLIPYVASGEGGVTKRTVGAYRASGSITMLQDSLAYFSTAASLLTPGATGKLKLYLTTGTYFEIWYPRFAGNEYSAATDQNNAVTLPWTWTAYTNVAGTMTIGKITKAKKEATPDTAWFGTP